uniref:Uncharacterized protein n=1 Tax=Anguilla anguilla TaxID=7936 RepID=A0A0E9TAP6_ANGAN
MFKSLLLQSTYGPYSFYSVCETSLIKSV